MEVRKKWKWEIVLETGLKTCSCCKIEKKVSEFSFSKSSKDKLNYYCNECLKQKALEYKIKNPERRKQTQNKYSTSDKGREKKRQYRSENAEYFLERSKKYREENREKIQNQIKEWRKENPNKFKEYNKTYVQNNPTKRKESLKKYKDKVDSDPVLSFSKRVRRNISMAFDSGVKPMKTEQILGCTMDEFRKYISTKFWDGMNFDNHGRGENKWHLDHVTPISLAKTEEEVIRLNHYTNFQPLWEKDNLEKSNKLDYQLNK